MHDAVYDQSPSYINDVFVPLSDLPGHSRLRSAAAGQYDMPFTPRQFGCRALSVAAPTKWNNLPANLRSIADITAFKTAIKTHFLNKHLSKRLYHILQVFASFNIMLMFCMYSAAGQWGVRGAI